MRVATFTLAWVLALAPAAIADDVTDNGEGFLGETDDQLVTFFSLGVVLFFASVVIIGTIIQSRLDRRKDEQKATRARYQRRGW